MSSDISRNRTPLRMHMQTLCMRGICVGGKFFPHIWNRWPWFACSMSHLYGCTIKINWVIPQNSGCVSAHAQNYVGLERDDKSATTIVLGDQDLLLRVSNSDDLAAYMAIFNHSFTRHARKRLFMSFQWKFWHQNSIPGPRFPCRERYFGDLKTFSVDFCIRLCWMSTVLLLPVYFIYWPIKFVTCFSPQVWSWYDHPLYSYRDLAFLLLIHYVTLTFNILTLVSGHTCRVTWSTPPLSLKLLRLSVLELWVLTLVH